MSQVSNASRRARGLRRLELWLPEDYIAKLDALCAESGYARTDQVMALIDVEAAALAKLRRGGRPK